MKVGTKFNEQKYQEAYEYVNNHPNTYIKELTNLSKEDLENGVERSFVIEEEDLSNQLLESELLQIRQWFTSNDWKVNKIVVGEWETSDPRWVEYLEERNNKRQRQDELRNLLSNKG